MSHESSKDVKLKGKVVDTVTVTVFDSFDELVANVPEKDILEYYNQLNLTKTMNKCRAEHAPKSAGKKAKRIMAFNLCTPEEIQACVGDFEALNKLMESKMDQVEAQMEGAEGQAEEE